MFGFLPFVGELCYLALVHLDFLGLEGQSLNQVEVGISDEGTEDPEEGFLVLVVGLSRDVEVLQVALAMESDLAGFNLTVLLVNLVSHQHDGDVVADTRQVLVPLRDIFVGDSGRHVEHQNGGVASDVVSFSEATKFFLSGSVPQRESDGTVVGVEGDGTDLDPLGGNVLLFELSSDVPLDKSSLTDTSIADENDLELSNGFDCLHKLWFTSIS